MAVRFIAVALSLAGCSSPVALLSSEGLSALLLVEASSSGGVVITAHDLETGPLQREADAGLDTYALGYRASLASLGLRAGSVAVAEVGRALPTPDAVHALEGTEWAEVELPAALRAIQLARTDDCASFAPTQRAFPREPSEIARLALPIDRERVLIATSLPRHFVVTATSITERALDLPSLGGAIRGDEMWLAGPGRRVIRGHPSRGFTEVPGFPFELVGAAHVAASPPGSPLEVFVTDPTLRVARFDGERWSEIRAASGVGHEDLRPGLAWISEGNVALIGNEDDRVIELSRDGFERPTRLELPLKPSPDTLYSIGRVEGVGVAVSSRYAVTYLRDGSGWRRLELPTVTPTADVIFDLGGSFMAGGQDGVFVEWRRDGTVCAPISGFGFQQFDVIAPLGAGFVGLSGIELEQYYLIVGVRG